MFIESNHTCKAVNIKSLQIVVQKEVFVIVYVYAFYQRGGDIFKNGDYF